ncbi:BC85_0335 family putative methyltransferase [Mycoplasma sp. Mirounga ES2805-ORL]|uniref:BC85_0335 family putative methyltransferase n=1 Tax=Mycoplasma sp. Mirounga ES2805-ORL TaxID=754514 RepID=UPI00197CACE3|nr:hypothetical protein [Mycoplasma sp. Mirounga ES2805-ORL]QSF13985.1 hypothetical protein JXZ90_01705 [Mycoplasma sp. Mirounga ES2805-ORL]
MIELLTFDNVLRSSLFYSAIAVVLIAIIIYIILVVVTKKIKSKVRNEELEKLKFKIQEQRAGNLKNIPLDIKEYFKSNLNNEDLENLVNTIYLNDANNVLLVGNKLEYPALLFSYQSEANIKVFNYDLDARLWNNAVLEFPEFFKKKIDLIDKIDEKFKLIFAINSTQLSQTIYEKYYEHLENNGMLIILENVNTKRDVKTLTSFLKTKKIVYEVSKVKSNFVYIVKKDI